MIPTALQLAFFVIEEGIKLEPSIAAELQSLFSKGVPTEADWVNLRSRVSARTYKSFVPDTDLPDSESNQ